jgi:cation diffusion facilitator family transporter
MKKETRLTLAIGLSLLFMVFEITGGLWANSLAILSDAAHLLTDVAGFAIALLATMMAAAPASKHYSFGLARAEVLGALLSILSLWVLTFWLIVEATERSMTWYRGGALDIDGKLMFVIACIGVLVNICLSCVFMVCPSSHLLPHDHHCRKTMAVPFTITVTDTVMDTTLITSTEMSKTMAMITTMIMTTMGTITITAMITTTAITMRRHTSWALLLAMAPQSMTILSTVIMITRVLLNQLMSTSKQPTFMSSPTSSKASAWRSPVS